ncbi:MAG: glycosyltransferase family 2 protein [Candidatus Nanopelagicales bacterium]|nr:glycosyltransferase family 2 protein [Candidatus Nanopelagicales bacterium]
MANPFGHGGEHGMIPTLPGSLSVVVPCFNEESSVEELVARIGRAASGLVADFEVLIIDDGSTDGTLRQARLLADLDARVRYVSLSRNFGKEGAIYAGLLHARGESVLLMDGDLQHPPEVIRMLLEKRAETGADQVIARRTRAGDPPIRTLLTRICYGLMNRAVDVRLADGEGDFRLLSRRAVAAVLELSEANRFSKGLFAWIGFPSATVDYENVSRAHGRSRWSTRHLINYGIDGVMSFNSRPLRTMIHLGYVITILSLLYVAWLVMNAIVFGVSAPGYITVIAAVVGFGGIQLLSLGVIGEYVGRMYVETKNRPKYFIAETGGSGLGGFRLAEQLSAGNEVDVRRVERQISPQSPRDA